MKKRSFKFSKILATITICLFVIGCSSNQDKVDLKSPQAIQKEKWEMAMPKFSLSDENIKKWLYIEELNFITRSSDELILITTKFKNNSNSNKKFTYKIMWFDADGIEIETIMSRPKTVNISSGKYFAINGISPGAKAKDFKIEIYQN